MLPLITASFLVGQVDIGAIDGKFLPSPAPGQPAGGNRSGPGWTGGWTQEGPGYPVDNGARSRYLRDVTPVRRVSRALFLRGAGLAARAARAAAAWHCDAKRGYGEFMNLATGEPARPARSLVTRAHFPAARRDVRRLRQPA
jgi:hypothetical protein